MPPLNRSGVLARGMKRTRTISKSTESIVAGGKDEPPKKISKKRVKSVTQSPRSRSDSQSSPVSSTPGPVAMVVKLSAPVSATKLGSLPMYGEHLPEGGPKAIPKLAVKTCGNLTSIMNKLKELKMKGVKVSSVQL